MRARIHVYLLVIGVAFWLSGCNTNEFLRADRLKPEKKTEALLVHSSVVLILSDDDLSSDEAAQVMDKAILSSDLLKQAGQAVVSEIQAAFRTQLGLHLRYRRDAILKMKNDETDKDLIKELRKTFEQKNSGPSWGWAPLYILYPPLYFVHLAMEDDFEKTGVSRYFDAPGPSFHAQGMDRDDVKPLIAAAKAQGASYPAYVSIGVGAKLHLEKGCTVLVRITVFDADSNLLLRIAGTAESGEAEKVKGGLIFTAAKKVIQRELARRE